MYQMVDTHTAYCCKNNPLFVLLFNVDRQYFGIGNTKLTCLSISLKVLYRLNHLKHCKNKLPIKGIELEIHVTLCELRQPIVVNQLMFISAHCLCAIPL